jgi:hypothetical protein
MPNLMRLIASLFILHIAAVASAADDSGLQGCWQSQHIHMTYNDGARSSQNGDCTTLYENGYAKGRCYREDGDFEMLLSYELIKPGLLRITSLDIATGKPKGPPGEVSYRIDDKWMMIEREFVVNPSSPDGKRQPKSMKSLVIRIQPDGDKKVECKPRGANPLRTGRTPVSSLALTLPSGWEPWLVDPASDKLLGPAVNSNFLIGLFVQEGITKKLIQPSHVILVLEDTRSGPLPVRAAEFAALKKRFASEMTAAKITCDLPDLICATVQLPGGIPGYTELLNVRGRVAMVISSVRQPEAISISQLRKSVRTFVDQLRIDNQR